MMIEKSLLYYLLGLADHPEDRLDRLPLLAMDTHMMITGTHHITVHTIGGKAYAVHII